MKHDVRRGSLAELRSYATLDRILRQMQPPKVFCKKGVLKNLAKLTEKHLCMSLFVNKVSGFRPATLSKKRLRHMCLPVVLQSFQ